MSRTAFQQRGAPGRRRRQAGNARPECHIVVMARWPAPGRCKRRLAASCGSTQRAAAMQVRLSDHTLQVAAVAAAAGSAIHGQAVNLRLAVDGVGPGALRRWQQAIERRSGWPTRGAVEIRMQGGGNLGCRMQRQLQQGFAAGAERVVLIGTDLPALEWRDLTAALARLQTDPLVIGPAVDGGYWLIGMNRDGFRRSGAQLMSGIGWGGTEVLNQTLERAGQLGIPVVLLRRQRDLDNRSDLAAWMRPPDCRGGLLPASPWR